MLYCIPRTPVALRGISSTNSTPSTLGGESCSFTKLYYYETLQKGSVLWIRDPVPVWPRDPGWVKNQDPDPPIIFPRALKQCFGLNYFNSLMWIRDKGWKKFGSGINIPNSQHWKWCCDFHNLMGLSSFLYTRLSHFLQIFILRSKSSFFDLFCLLVLKTQSFMMFLV
jgi:hypothetical protein